MAENSKKPRIRFKGFTEAWEQRKLGETVQITMGQSPDGATYLNSPSDFILVQGNADLVDGWVCPRVWTTQKTKTCNAGDLIMSVRAPAGAMGKTSYNAVIGRGVAAIKGNEFIFQQLTKMDSEGFWKKDSSGSTFESLNSEAIKNAEIKIPKHIEQVKIGTLFENLDNLITLHQRKYDKLLNVKKALLDKMFPKNGKNTPEIRFKGFTEAWEQRKFNNFFEERNERSGDGELISVTINSGIKKFSELNRFDTKPEDMSKYKVVKENDIAYNSMRMWQGASGLSPYNGILSPAYTVITPKANVSSLFFSYQIKKPQMIHLFEINSQGLTKDTWNLKFAPFSQIDTSAPKSFDEQQKIGSLFKDLDNLITLHQRKCEKLKNVKKSLLEKMFV